jgi:hypothetical protein
VDISNIIDTLVGKHRGSNERNSFFDLNHWRKRVLLWTRD